MTERFEVQRTIPADAATIFRRVRPARPRRHRRLRDAAERDRATRPAGRRHLRHPHGPRGARRSAHGQVRRDRHDHRLRAGQLHHLGGVREGFPSIGHYYGYRLEPVDGGTLVTSIYDWSQVGEQWKATGGGRSSRVGAEGHARHPRADRARGAVARRGQRTTRPSARPISPTSSSTTTIRANPHGKPDLAETSATEWPGRTWRWSWLGVSSLHRPPGSGLLALMSPASGGGVCARCFEDD